MVLAHSRDGGCLAESRSGSNAATQISPWAVSFATKTSRSSTGRIRAFTAPSPLGGAGTRHRTSRSGPSAGAPGTDWVFSYPDSWAPVGGLALKRG